MEETNALRRLQKEVKEMKAHMVTREELESWIETFHILSNAETMEQIRKSEEEIARGEWKEITSVRDMK